MHSDAITQQQPAQEIDTQDIAATAADGQQVDDGDLESVAGGNPIAIAVATAVAIKAAENLLENSAEAWQAVKDGWNAF